MKSWSKPGKKTILDERQKDIEKVSGRKKKKRRKKDRVRDREEKSVTVCIPWS